MAAILLSIYYQRIKSPPPARRAFYVIGALSYYIKNSLLIGCGTGGGSFLCFFSLCRLFPKQCLQDRLIVIVSVAVAFLEKILYLLGG